MAKRPVQIRLTTEIREYGEKATSTVEESGSFVQRGGTTVLTFTEHQEEQEDIDSFVTIKPEKVSVKRTGAIDMLQIFREKHVTENVYKHAYGTILMETHTDQIQYQEPALGKAGRLFISYSTKLNGEGSRRHRLTLTFKEEMNE